MTFHHDAETDSLYIDLSDKPSVESQEVLPGVVLDYDDAGRVCGIDVDYARMTLDLKPEIEAEVSRTGKVIERCRSLK